MNTNKIVRCILLGLLAGTLGGCNPTFHPALNYIAPARVGVRPHALDAALVLTKELQEYKIVTALHSGSEKYEYPVGTVLYQYAQDAAKASFRSMQVTPDAPAPSVAIVLYPRLVKASQVMPLFHDQEMTFVVEWTAKEPTTGKTIFLTSVQGKATMSLHGINLGPKGAECIQLALADLYKNTVAALASSTEIQQYSAARQK